MPKEQSPGKKPTSRRYSPEEKAAAVRMVRALRAELGTEQGTVARVAGQLGYGVESPVQPALVSSIKIRQAGFGECMDTEDMMRKWIAHFQRERLLPPRQW